MSHLPYGMITLTLFDIIVIVGIQQIGELFEPSMTTKTKPKFIFNNPAYSTYLKEHYVSTKNAKDHEHIAFPTYWHSRYVFCSRSFKMAKNVFL